MPRIAELIAYHVRIPLKRTVKHASHTRDDTDSLVVCCRLTDGTRGWGEGLPRSYVTGDTIESVFQQLKQTDWRQRRAGLGWGPSQERLILKKMRGLDLVLTIERLIEIVLAAKVFQMIGVGSAHLPAIDHFEHHVSEIVGASDVPGLKHRLRHQPELLNRVLPDSLDQFLSCDMGFRV